MPFESPERQLAGELQQYTMTLTAVERSPQMPPLADPTKNDALGSPKLPDLAQSPLANMGKKRRRLQLPERTTKSPGHCAKMAQIFEDARRSIESEDQAPRTPNIKKYRFPLSERKGHTFEDLASPKIIPAIHHSTPTRLPRTMRNIRINKSPSSSPSRCMPPRSRKSKASAQEPLSSGFNTPTETMNRYNFQTEGEGSAIIRHYFESTTSPQLAVPPNSPSFSPQSSLADPQDSPGSPCSSFRKEDNLQPLVVRRFRSRRQSNKENQRPIPDTPELWMDSLSMDIDGNDNFEDPIPVSRNLASPTVIRHKSRRLDRIKPSQFIPEVSLAELSPDVDRYRKGNRPRRERCPSYFDKDILRTQSLSDEDMLDEDESLLRSPKDL